MREYMLGRSWGILLNLWQQSSPLSAHFSTAEALWKCSWRMWGRVLDCVALPFLPFSPRENTIICVLSAEEPGGSVNINESVSSSLACRQTQEVILQHFPPCRHCFENFHLRRTHPYVWITDGLRKNYSSLLAECLHLQVWICSKDSFSYFERCEPQCRL